MYCTDFYYEFTLTEQSKTGTGENLSQDMYVHLNTKKLNLPLKKYVKNTRDNYSLISRISSHPGSQMGL